MIQRRCSNNTVQIELPPKLINVFSGDARYRAAYGGRGSGKTRSFAIMAVLRAYELSEAGKSGIVVCAREYLNSVNNSLQAEIMMAINSLTWLRDYFDISERQIKTKNNLISFCFLGLSRNLSSIKSMANIHIFWIDEAETVSEEAWVQLVPTVREENSEIWATWNPVSKQSAVHKRYRINQHRAEELRLKIVELNWRDNPWFPKVLDEERLNDKKFRPEYYNHIWEGDFKQVFDGSYFTNYLIQAKEEGRIGNVCCDPLMSYRSFWDIGGTGAKSDATVIWIAQFIGQEIRVLNYYEAQGQPLASHIDWMRINGYGQASITLPHDGRSCDKVHNVSFESVLVQAGFCVEIVPNQGAGAARARIEACRRLFGRVWFNQPTTQAGLEALQWYHEKRDNLRGIGLGPNHDWSSHGADAFGLMCLTASPDQIVRRPKKRYSENAVIGGWMSI